MFRIKLPVNHIHVTNAVIVLDGILFVQYYEGRFSSPVVCFIWFFFWHPAGVSCWVFNQSILRKDCCFNSAIFCSSTEINPLQAKTVEPLLSTGLRVRWRPSSPCKKKIKGTVKEPISSYSHDKIPNTISVSQWRSFTQRKYFKNTPPPCFVPAKISSSDKIPD